MSGKTNEQKKPKHHQVNQTQQTYVSLK